MAIARFGPYRLDTRSLELRKEGQRVRLRPQPCRLLVILVSQPDRLVTREELRRAMWPDDVYVRFDLGLNSCLKQIRRALGESADAPAYIETLTRRGYRFVGKVAYEPDAPAAPRVLVAVMPFESLDAAAGQRAPIADGLTEDVMVQLSQCDPSRVGVTTGPHPGAGFLLEGRVREGRDRLRVTARLMAAVELRQLWAGTYDAPLSDPIDAQEQLAASLTRDLSEALAALDGQRPRSWDPRVHADVFAATGS